MWTLVRKISTSTRQLNNEHAFKQNNEQTYFVGIFTVFISLTKLFHKINAILKNDPFNISLKITLVIILVNIKIYNICTISLHVTFHSLSPFACSFEMVNKQV